MDPDEVFHLAEHDPNEWIPPKQAAEAIRRAVAAERKRLIEVVEDCPGIPARSIEKAIEREAS